MYYMVQGSGLTPPPLPHGDTPPPVVWGGVCSPPPVVWCGVVGLHGLTLSFYHGGKAEEINKYGETQIEQIEYLFLNVCLCVDRRWLHSCAPAQ